MTRRVEIEVEIDEGGEVRFKVKGEKGKGCVELLAELEEAVGEVEARTLTPEYYEAAVVATTKQRT
jgi:hypothetical protein